MSRLKRVKFLTYTLHLAKEGKDDVANSFRN